MHTSIFISSLLASVALAAPLSHVAREFAAPLLPKVEPREFAAPLLPKVETREFAAPLLPKVETK